MEATESAAVRTEAVENYLKTIYQLGEDGGKATVKAIAATTDSMGLDPITAQPLAA